MSRGRKTIYTDDMPQKAYEALANCGSVMETCHHVGISRDTYYEWKNKKSKYYKSEFSDAIERGEIAGAAWLDATIRKAAIEEIGCNPSVLIHMAKKKDFNPHYQAMIKKGNFEKKLDFITSQYNDGVISIDTYEQLLRCLERSAGVLDKTKFDEFEKKLNMVLQKLNLNSTGGG